MNLSKKFEELISKQLESFGCSMGVTNLVMYLASAKQGTKASFEMIGQWPQIDRLLTSIEDDPSLKVSSPNSCLLYTSPSPRDLSTSRMPSSA